jgi:hypothetical protein
MDFDAPDLLSAVDTTKQLGAEQQDRLSITTALGSGASPQARRQVRRSRSSIRRHKPSRVQRANSPYGVPEGNFAQQSDRSPLHATETNAPDRHDGLAKRRSGERRLWPRSHRPHTILGHGRKFCQHFVDKNVDIGKGIPRAGRRFGRTDVGSHVMAPMLMIIVLWGMVVSSGTALNST